MRNESTISEDAIFKIGKVISVDGRTVAVKVDKTKNTSHLLYKGELLKNISVGGYIKIAKGFTRIVGKVEGEFTNEDKQFWKRDFGSEKEKINRVLKISLLGFFQGNSFERGIKEMPLIDNECFLLHKKEFDQVHNFIRKGDDSIAVGTLALEKGQEIRLGVNSLFASHIGIFGNTGSGKSYTLAKIYRELFEKYRASAKFKTNAKIFIIDFNGEYVSSGAGNDDIIVDKQFKNSYQLSTRTDDGDKYPITTTTLNDPDFWIVFLEATEKTQAPFLKRAIEGDFIAPKLKTEAGLKGLIQRIVLAVTTAGDKELERAVVINLLKELNDCLGGNETIEALIQDYNVHLKYHNANHCYYYQNGAARTYSSEDAFKTTYIDAKIAQLAIDVAQIGAIDRIRLQILMQYYDDITRGFANKEHLSPLIKRLDKRIDDLKKVIEVKTVPPDRRNIVIVSLREVNVQMRKILPLLFCKKLYNDKKTQNNDKKYLNIIVDEAHNILSEHSERESEQWKDYRLETFEEIIKEGRKFGVFLTIASQRPSDISPTIISQLHNYFLHRLINNEDIKAVEKTISYLDKVSFDYLPILPTGTCVVAGLLANIPVVVDIGKIEPDRHEPKNKTIRPTENWA